MIAKHQRKDILWAVYHPVDSESYQIQPILIDHRDDYGSSIEFTWDIDYPSKEFKEVYDRGYAIFDITRATFDKYEYCGIYWFGTEKEATDWCREIVRLRIESYEQELVNTRKTINELKESWCYEK